MFYGLKEFAQKQLFTLIKERGGGQNFSTSFWMRFNQAPYVVTDSNLFSLTLSFYFREIL